MNYPQHKLLQAQSAVLVQAVEATGNLKVGVMLEQRKTFGERSEEKAMRQCEVIFIPDWFSSFRHFHNPQNH